MKKLMLLAAGLVASLALAGCGAMNAYTGAAINAGEAGYAGASQNVRAIDDAKFVAWENSACLLPIGALQRNATGNPDAVKAALTACPVPNMAIVSTTNGQISVTTMPTVTAPTPTAGYVAPTTATTSTAVSK